MSEGWAEEGLGSAELEPLASSTVNRNMGIRNTSLGLKSRDANLTVDWACALGPHGLKFVFSTLHSPPCP
jgi:hypothetical protein